AMQVESKQAVQRKVGFAYACAGAMDFAVKRENQCNCMFGYGVWRIFRDTRDGDPQFLCCNQVYIVKTRATQGDQAYIVAGDNCKRLCIQMVVDEHTDCLRALSGKCGAGIQPRFEVNKLVPACIGCIKIGLVVGFGAEYCNAHVALTPSGREK